MENDIHSLKTLCSAQMTERPDPVQLPSRTAAQCDDEIMRCNLNALQRYVFQQFMTTS